MAKGKTRTLYPVEVGVLLRKNHKEYKDYSNVFGGNHAFYNETTAVFLTSKERDEWARKRLQNGVERTYAVFLKPKRVYLSDADEHDVERWGWADKFETGMFGYTLADVKTALQKKNGEIQVLTL